MALQANGLQVILWSFQEQVSYYKGFFLGGLWFSIQSVTYLLLTDWFLCDFNTTNKTLSDHV